MLANTTSARKISRILFYTKYVRQNGQRLLTFYSPGLALGFRFLDSVVSFLIFPKIFNGCHSIVEEFAVTSFRILLVGLD